MFTKNRGIPCILNTLPVEVVKVVSRVMIFGLLPGSASSGPAGLSNIALGHSNRAASSRQSVLRGQPGFLWRPALSGILLGYISIAPFRYCNTFPTFLYLLIQYINKAKTSIIVLLQLFITSKTRGTPNQAPQTVIGKSPKRLSCRHILSSQLRLGSQSKMSRCASSAPTRRT